MTYRKNTRLGETTYVRLMPSGRIKVVFAGIESEYVGNNYNTKDWEAIYNSWSIINEREFQEIYQRVKLLI